MTACMALGNLRAPPRGPGPKSTIPADLPREASLSDSRRSLHLPMPIFRLRHESKSELADK